ncbi:MAG: 2-hydroxycyclohexanecarboxyl-CoA dehydrogenase [Solirubrobacteraceae bacterium]|nr:2-hydroxycyclohexanecarboxyl-CoA dehydrogenase [Solirubrobacteraceae bacterium]
MTPAVALVTGAASGIGRACVQRLVAAGTAVAAVDLDEAPMRDLGALSLVADVTDAAAVEAAIAHAERELGGLDAVVNVAGITGSQEAAECHVTPVDEWRRVLDVNLTGPFLVCRAALEGMLERGSGTIVNVASVAGIVAFPGRCAYSASKGGVVALTRSLAADYAGRGIRANAVCPGMVDTPMTRWRLEQPDLREAVLAKIPAGRVASADEVADAVLLLAGDGLAYMNGAMLVLDGGWTAV